MTHPAASRLLLSFGFAAAALLAHAPAVHAQQAWPAKPMRMYVPFPPGGPADIIARTATARLGEVLGHQIVLENRAGGGGNIAAEAAARSAPDGYTLFLLSSALVANQFLYTKSPVNVQKDFTAIANFASFPLVLAVHPSLPVKSVPDLIAFAKGRPNAINYGSAGSGGGAHLAAESFRAGAGIDIVHIPYKGTGPAVTDLVGGQVALMFASYPSVIGHIRAGKLAALGVTSSKRMPGLPNVPAIAEVGGPGLKGYEIASWFGMAGPAGMPADIVNRLNAETAKVLVAAEFQERLRTEGGEALVMNPAQFSEFIRSESARWQKIVKDSGAKLD